MEKTIELNPYQQTAYWWINIIRAKVDELYIYKNRTGKLKDDGEEKFLSIFGEYSEKDWRNIYISLQECIKNDVYNYIPTGDMLHLDCFSQDTAKGRHTRLNEEISKILNIEVPDIRLANIGKKDSVIYTDYTSSYEWYKSCGIAELPVEYKCDYNYVLTGDLEELDFYNLVLATCLIIHDRGRNFISMDILRRVFCEEYKKHINIPNDIDDIYKEFNNVFIAFQERIDISRFWEKIFHYWYPKKTDKNGLDCYMKLANEFASTIINEFDYHQDGKDFTKSLVLTRQENKL